ncbi:MULTISPECIES: ABC transporter ATP-binding protein [Aneurinibacillus]|uniref:ATP-binding protein n=1 Tax=Aneurinibacillus thermoaerophilus TaxID=143495 RepID=Q6T1X4_ANETH|nr:MULTISPECIES: ABC transporter ATP-binding protein [Aneurinibacillus]AAS55714.1 ATP-binding protein [Aneurinibacillus thermoaerophilus]AMA71695.1 sugar ABC transporter ATP-binding protein [Aneurinibacillus sp. XH2]MED0738411.1 ABC transporter ATP-binding protein [Aneurinibacillus thermoaerophilus]MED0757683.1 ABC transporter ATP-binding protein [Aneurinibacillus thermoaerophilus]MED0759322.1 ABC transporter ATP-binding protein [Aneurinibacillus thermoaerophilus]
MSRIEVKNLGKKYKKYARKWHRLFEWITGRKKHEEKFVLKGLSFNVLEGESVGIIGHNGAGKSTLLKILTGTTQPSEGEFKVNGRVAALLELGMGFHPDFTGIQNVYMSGQLMGLSNEEITRLLPEIERFAEIGDYIHQPLRTYSSGMAVRLAFSVATAIRPDVLIVDEALSVGDAYFQHKCFDRIKKFRSEGTTILFVSHDPGAVKNLCDRAILLDQGIMIKEGTPEEVLDYYNAIIAKREADYNIKQSIGKDGKVDTRSGNGDIKIEKVELFSGNRKVNAVQVGEEIEIKIDLKCMKKIDCPTVGFMFKDRLGNEVFGTNTYYLKKNIESLQIGEKFSVIFKIPANFGIGNYSLTVAAHEGHTHTAKNYEWWDHAALLQVVPGDEAPFVGVCYLKATVEFSKGVMV